MQLLLLSCSFCFKSSIGTEDSSARTGDRLEMFEDDLRLNRLCSFCCDWDCAEVESVFFEKLIVSDFFITFIDFTA
jgi:hypothetical protein